jgi:hypothetical protein
MASVFESGVLNVFRLGADAPIKLTFIGAGVCVDANEGFALMGSSHDSTTL